MRIPRNMSHPVRIACVAGGATLFAVPFATAMQGWARVAVPIFGLVAVAAGAVGW